MYGTIISQIAEHNHHNIKHSSNQTLSLMRDENVVERVKSAKLLCF